MMINPFALLSAISLFSSVMAQNVTWQVAVGNNLGDLVFNPPYIVS
jgi:surface antigen